MTSDFENGLREDRIYRRQENDYLDGLFEVPSEPDPDLAYDDFRQIWEMNDE